jgi:two-component system invasion response regulator UvrY
VTAAPANLREARILLVDDHAVVRQGLAQILRQTMPRAKFGEAGTAAQALDLVRRRAWNIVLLDITLPDRNGLEVLKDIRQLAPDLPVLILTMHPEEQLAVRALKAGAAGYVTKNTASEVITHAVGRVLAGGRYITESLADTLANEVGRGADRMPHERLSDREFEVFGLLARGHNVKDVAAQLGISVQTVSTYRARVLDKMGLRTNAELVQYGIRNRLFE